MKKHLFLLLALAMCLGLHAETEYSLKRYFETNIMKLDPIEGEYNVSCHQYVVPSAGAQSSQKWTTTWYIKKEGKMFAIYNDRCEHIFMRLQRIGETNAYVFDFNDYLYGYEKHQFVLQNDVMFEFSHEFSPSTVKRQINNVYNVPLSYIHSYFQIRAIKSYPTSSMYLDAAKKEAKQAEQEYQKALEEAQKKAGWSGSGFALNRGHIVTNYHVVEDAKTILIKGVRGNFNIEYKAKVVASDKVNDIAIIKIEDERFKGFGEIPYKIKRSMSEVGESVWGLGYPMTSVMGEEIKFTDGKISSRTGIQGDISVYQISVPIQPGNSGGALFDNYGNIVGITSSGLNREVFNSENVNYAIKTSYLYNLVESSLSTSILPQGKAMQGQSMTQKIKLAKSFVFIIMCSSDPNFHSEKISVQKTEMPVAQQLPQNTNKEVEKSSLSKVRRDTLINGDIIINNPPCKNNTDILITKITFTKNETILDFTWHNTKYNSGWCNISGFAFLKDTADNKYYLKFAEGISYTPDRDNVPYNTSKTFRLHFAKLPNNVETFDFIESAESEWKIYSIQVK